MSWFLRGAQSAIFYYVSCAPCATYNFGRRRAKQKARADKETKELMKYASRRSNGHIVIPDEFEGATHERITGVGAFTTNIYWREDMLMGPQPKRGRNRGNTIENISTRDERPANVQRSQDDCTRRAGFSRKRSDTAASQGSFPASSVDSARPSTARDMIADDETPLQYVENRYSQVRDRYQRPDEALWGDPTVEKNWQYYARGRNPSLNSLCPAVVSTKPATASQARWMLQPPPPAKVMEGRQAPITTQPLEEGFGLSIPPKKRVGGAFAVENIRKPDQAHICQLGDRMSELFESPNLKRSRFGFDGIAVGSEVDSVTDEPRTPEIRKSDDGLDIIYPRRSSLQGWHSAENQRTPKFQDHSYNPHSWELSKSRFDERWFSSHQEQSSSSGELATRKSRDNRPPDGYHSEPEPLRLAGVSSQDFASTRVRLHESPEAPKESTESSEPRNTQSRDQPMSETTSSSSGSVPSSASSLQPLKELALQEHPMNTSDPRPLPLSHKVEALDATFNRLQEGSFTHTNLAFWEAR